MYDETVVGQLRNESYIHEQFGSSDETCILRIYSRSNSFECWLGADVCVVLLNVSRPLSVCYLKLSQDCFLLYPFKFIIHDHAIIWVTVSVKSIKWGWIHLQEMRKARTAAVKVPITFQNRELSASSHARHSLPFYSLGWNSRYKSLLPYRFWKIRVQSINNHVLFKYSSQILEIR